ncbi:phosphodiester glycosidase family protein [Bhargavaea ginsengi]|uniref:phosphodiester glycosidase family protein n=1 Tax=Bhargavaea ginsengi TaxID=426757 RepID=UPI00203C103C|nr:phosphodiester glycosidase family protein [Bhargavaea ginsengi]MCM3088096.1 phosphodiester glycosidase family protein [Bhargavaea ginsengi]
MSRMKAVFSSALASVMILSVPAMPAEAAQVTVTPGVEHSSGASQGSNIHRLSVDMTRPGVSVEALTNNPMDNLLQTSVLSRNHSREGHTVVGSINGSFFHMGTINPLNYKMPAYLLMKGGVVNTYGVIEHDPNEYMNVPSAFAVTKDGNGHIGEFGYEATVMAGGKNHPITSINKRMREVNEVVLYTDSYSYRQTRQNEYGMEIVLTNFNDSIEEDYRLGRTVEATVSGIYHKEKGVEIPENGAVLSIHGTENILDFGGVKIGDKMALNVGLTAPWNEAEYVLASGPLLVQDGQVDIEMKSTSDRSRTRSPRTAVATNRDGSEVFLVTVDGRNAGGSKGMTLPEFAQYLKSIGAYNALNLDGGGSTTMAVRPRGYQYPVVVNRPSDGAERAVSTILSAISYEATGVPTHMSASISSTAVPKGGRAKVTVDYVTDINFHPVKVDASKLTYSVEGNIGTVSSDGTFTATAPGKGSVTVRMGNASKSFQVEVTALPGNALIHGFNDASVWKAESARAKTTLRFDGAQAPKKEGANALSLQYDFTGTNGTSASYAVTDSIKMSVRPERLGLWVYGDGAKHWLRGTIQDGTGKEYTIDFTEQGGLNWTGWKYVTSILPDAAVSPISVKKLYVTEPSDSNKNKGTIYLDRMIADYNGNHVEQLFNDVGFNYWAINEISKAVDNGWINGYIDGTFKPESNLSRAHAAVLISRALGKTGKAVTTDPYPDVKKTHPYAREIVLMRELGIMQGDTSTGKFNPNANLTRAQMAAVLDRAYELEVSGSVPLIRDVPQNDWAYVHVAALSTNGLTTLNEGKYRPHENVRRSQFAAFLVRAEQLN